MILVGIKPIVYIFGAFGLVAFAWGAIFNKISWRHFSYIAIGLFLVANAGRLVEYAVTYDGSGYYIGQWQDGADTGNKDDSNRLAAALNDTYSTYTYKFVPECNGDDSDPEDCIKVKEYFSDYIKDEYVAKEFNFNVRADSSLAQAALAERGYCQRDIGAGFFNGIKNCVADVVGTIKTAANIVNTAIATVNHVNNRIQDINASVNHIRETFNNMEGGNFFDIMNGAGAILNDIESIGQDGRSIGGAVTGGVSTIVNNASNIGNTSQSGGILNDLQDGVGAIGGTGGNIANFADEGIDDIVDTGNGIADTVGLGGEDSGDGNSGGGSGGGSGDGNSGEDTPPTPAEEAEENYEETVEQMDQLNREIQQLQREIEQNQENLAQAQAAMEAACEEDPQSTMCEIYTDQVANYENMIKQATTGLGEKQSDLEVLEDQAEEQYEGMLTEQQKEAQERAETLSAQVTTDCEDPTSDACKQSMKELEKALAELEKINEELEELNKPDSNIPQQEMDEDDGSSNS